MSARINRSVAATVAAAALLGSAALAFPAAANAAAPAPAATKPAALQLSVTPTARGSWLQPGGATRTEIVKVTNTTGKAQRFMGNLMATTEGAIYLRAGELKASVTALGKTPATSTVFQPQTPGYAGVFYATGTQFGAFTLPAHATFAWKLSVAATKAWPLNDGVLRFDVGVNRGTDLSVKKEIDFTLAKRTDGPMNESLHGDTSLSARHAAYETVTVTNRTGADLKQSWWFLPAVQQLNGARLAVDVWVGSGANGHWKTVTGHSLLVNGLPAWASETFKLRLRVVDYTAKTATVSTQLSLINWDGVVNPAGPVIPLTVHRG
ncbi:hypothetical protein [Streptacidiphilus jiangxiensis]|uniref:Uncharacterized protein n=1 Tax=Streptacidiphilus jiangxiensis TaxID=235985 RepID=A0A1H7PQP6_STRJI|nr:hypothetical protein [Streptacidiphilus jiangxiensis]SEL38092.1 hypothetical protein SAMN05414137_10875 [Streptacidiphilus jiangxiensis]